jgi:hypothetical protein
VARVAAGLRSAHTGLVTVTTLDEQDETATTDFSAVPSVDPEAVVDPFWLQLRGDSLLPALYMPPTMSRRHSAPMRVMAVVLIGVFLLATALGVCLTYGPPGLTF